MTTSALSICHKLFLSRGAQLASVSSMCLHRGHCQWLVPPPCVPSQSDHVSRALSFVGGCGSLEAGGNMKTVLSKKSQFQVICFIGSLKHSVILMFESVCTSVWTQTKPKANTNLWVWMCSLFHLGHKASKWNYFNECKQEAEHLATAQLSQTLI